MRGLYTLGGNAFGHQKQERWGSGLSIVADTFDDMSMASIRAAISVPCPEAWSATAPSAGAAARWAAAARLSGDERHTADRIKRPELHVNHCIFDVSNSFLFDCNDNPTKNIPFGNHHIWEDNTFVSIMCGLQA